MVDSETLALLMTAALTGGVIIGFLIRSWVKPINEQQLNQATRNALTFMKEGDAMRHTVFEFVKLARYIHPPTDQDWHQLVEHMCHPETPESIKQQYHRMCGTVIQKPKDQSQV